MSEAMSMWTLMMTMEPTMTTETMMMKTNRPSLRRREVTLKAPQSTHLNFL